MNGDGQGLGAARPRILLADDDRIVLESLGSLLEQEGYEVQRSGGARQAADLLDSGQFDLAIIDASMPGGNGWKLLDHARRQGVAVIVITAYGTIESAAEAIKRGAYDYLTKPIIDDDVRLAARGALQQRQLQAGNRRLQQVPATCHGLENVVGSEERMARVFDLVEAVADSRTTVLITGESGTGKSLIARAIHARSPRRDKPFVEVSCGALPDTLLESELFGYVKGAFTHAVADRAGKFAAAAGGTIFLDEISSASPQLQVKLLRVLQERRFEPVGSNQTAEADVRVILASNHDMAAEVEAGRFRRDLYYRINVVNIELPALRDRPGDVPLLAHYFLQKYRNGISKAVAGFSQQAMKTMQRYAWPGNVRELENCVERAVVLCRQAEIGPDDLPPAVLAGATMASQASVSAQGCGTLEQLLAEPEKQIILEALRCNNGNRQATAAQLGINRTTLYKKMKRHGLMRAQAGGRPI